MIEAARKVINHLFDSFTHDQANAFCTQYPALIEKKDRDFETVVPALLSTVLEADRVLSAHEST